MLTIHVEIDLNRRRMYVEPSFKITEDASYEIRNIHTVRKLKSSHNRLVATYTRGYEVHETLAAILFCLVRHLPNSRVSIEMQEAQSEIMEDALEIANLLLVWNEYTYAVQKLEQQVAEIDARAASYDRDVLMANLNVTYARENLEESPMDAQCVQRLKQALADRQRIGRNKRYDPKRRLKAHAQLSQLETEIRRLRPTFRKHVRLELRKLI